MNHTLGFIAAGLKPPSRLPLEKWAEASVRLDHTSYVQGRLVNRSIGTWFCSADVWFILEP